MERLVAKDPGERPHDALSVHEALEAVSTADEPPILSEAGRQSAISVETPDSVVNEEETEEISPLQHVSEEIPADAKIISFPRESARNPKQPQRSFSSYALSLYGFFGAEITLLLYTFLHLP